MSSILNSYFGSALNQPARELEDEIAFLNKKLVNMEKELLSKYRETFDKKVTSLTPMDDLPIPSGLPQVDSNSITSRLPRLVKDNLINRYSSFCGSQPLSHSGILHRSQSLSQIASHRRTTSSPKENMHSFHYLPSSVREVLITVIFFHTNKKNLSDT